jgi:hypothetical protein
MMDVIVEVTPSGCTADVVTHVSDTPSRDNSDQLSTPRLEIVRTLCIHTRTCHLPHLQGPSMKAKLSAKNASHLAFVIVGGAFLSYSTHSSASASDPL